MIGVVRRGALAALRAACVEGGRGGRFDGRLIWRVEASASGARRRARGERRAEGCMMVVWGELIEV